MKNPRLSWAALRSIGSLPAFLGFALSLLFLGGCSMSSGGATFQEGAVGDLLEKPDGGGPYFVAAHEGGRRSRLHLARLSWGRLADVYDVDPDGEVAAWPVMRDLVIREDVASDGADYIVETDPVTQKTRLVVLRTYGAPDDGTGTFESLVRVACTDLPTIEPRAADGGTVGTFSFLARNGVLVAEFDDLLEDGAEARDDLAAMVRVVTGYPPAQPFTARILFDPNFGGVADGSFHSARILVDTTISMAEMADADEVLPGNMVGLPASSVGVDAASVSLRLPTRIDVGSGQFRVLTNLRGSGLDPFDNGPVDLDSPTEDVVRAMRAGNETDLFRGFVRDEDEPTILGAWPLVVNAAYDAASGLAGFDFVVDVTFPSTCRAAPRTGDVLQVGTHIVQVTAPGSEPDVGTGEVSDVHVRTAGANPLPGANALLGMGQYHRPYDPSLEVEAACWVRFVPAPRIFPAGGVSPDATVGVRFSEPMSPETVRPFDSFRVVRGDASQPATAVDTVVGSLVAGLDLTEYAFAPLLSFDHAEGEEEMLHLDVVEGAQGVTDLAGNALALPFPSVEFTLDDQLPSVSTGGFVLRFSEVDEFDPSGAPPGDTPELRGQFIYDLDRGVIRPRPVVRQGWPVDESNVIPAQMTTLPLGFPEPLSPLGSKLQTLWRHADLGWDVRDELLYNLDVEALNWEPFGAQVVSDYFERLEIKLAHSYKLPDETTDPNGNLFYPESGLLDAPFLFSDNVLRDPRSPQKTVHSRGAGYLVDPNDAFRASSGNIMMPIPLSEADAPGGAFTWRDTAVLAKGAPDGTGIPLSIEVVAGLYPGMLPGQIAPAGQVPSYGLPLLMEFNCFPSNSGLGLNGFNLVVFALGQVKPSGRVHSTGGVNTLGNTVLVHPDLETVPRGGFDPAGQTTRSADPTLYFGQLDTVTRLSRAHSIWFPSGSAAPDYAPPVLEPAPRDLPPGTELVLEYRGASGFIDTDEEPFDAAHLDAYGDLDTGSAVFWGGDGEWTPDIDELDGAPYLQVRLTFVGNTANGQVAELSTLALAFER